MAERLLDSQRLERLLEKIKAVNIDNWKREEDSQGYEPHEDSPSVGWSESIVQYMISLNEFMIVIYRKKTLNSVGDNIIYGLKVFRDKVGSDQRRALDEVSEDPRSKQGEGKLQRTYVEVDRKYLENQELKKRDNQKRILEEFETVIS